MNSISSPRTLLLVTDLRQKQVDWIDAHLAMRGWTLTELSRRARVASTTLTRWRAEEGEDKGHVLSSRTVAAIERVLGARAYEMPTADGRAFAESEAEPYRAESGTAAEAAVAAITGGRNAVDPWILRTRSLDLRGYLPGDVVIVDLNARPGAGDVVCAQVYDWQRGRAETVFRIYEPPVLVAASTDAAQARPYVIDDQTVMVRGVVTGSLRLGGIASRPFRIVSQETQEARSEATGKETNAPARRTTHRLPQS